MTIFKFHGGIKLKNDYKLTNDTIQTIPDPNIFIVPLKQHIGDISEPVVEVGQHVDKYQLLAKISNNLGSNIHSPASGTIEKIALNPVIAHTHGNTMCIFLKPDNKNTIALLPDCKNTRKSILERIKFAGIVGLGGAGFPSYAKLTNNKSYLIINAAECEPYIGCDDALIQNKAEQIIKGIKIMQDLLKPKYTIVGIEDNKQLAFEALIAQSDTTIKIIQIPTLYPSGGEKQLIKILTNLDFAKNQIADNVVCYNVATIFSIYQAVVENIPMTERIVTLTGNACTKKGNYQIKIGTPISHIFDTLKIDKYAELISGGPFMGIKFTLDNQSVTKTNNCFIVADKNEASSNKTPQECVRCGRCAKVCPMSLLPQQLYWHRNNLEASIKYSVDNCIECACCSFICPSNIPLADIFKNTKREIYIAENKKQKSAHAKMRNEKKEARLLRLKKAREEKLIKQRAKIKKQATQQESDNNKSNEDKKLIDDAIKRTQRNPTDPTKSKE